MGGFQLLYGGEMAYCTCLMGFFIQNCSTCMRENVVSSMFDLIPPTIQEYIPINEDIPRYEGIGVNQFYN